MSRNFADPQCLLLGERYAPLTDEIGFANASMPATVEAFCAWQRPIQAARGVQVTCRTVSGSLDALLQHLLPLTNVEERRFLVLPTRAPWTAFFGNAYRGADVASMMRILAEDLQCQTVRLAATSGTRGYGALILEVWTPDPQGGRPNSRSIALADDGGKIRFEAFGEPLEFEEPRLYGRSAVRSRFSFEALRRYLGELGIGAFDESFYAPDGSGCLVEKQGPTAPGLAEFGLADA
jgi:hypothetical protein